MAMVKRTVDPSKELELLNFKAFLLENPELFIGKNNENEENNATNWNSDNRVSPESMDSNKEGKNQFIAFQSAMKLLLFYGQCLSLNPVTGILEKDVTKVRHRWISLRVLYTLIIGITQVASAVLCVYRFFGQNSFIRLLAFLSYHVCTSYITFMFLRVAAKWPSLMKELHNCGLDEYADPKLNFKCYLAFFIVSFFAFMEFVSSQMSRYTEVLDCSSGKNHDMFENFIKRTLPWFFFNSGFPYFAPIAVLMEVTVIISTFIWSYPDLFIISISIYLTSILTCINKKIEWALKNTYLPPSFWRGLREDYNRASQLVRSFDDRISGIVFVSFANNLFFICLQLYYTLGNGLKERQHYFRTYCPNYPSGPFAGYEATMYLVFSLSFLFGKFIAVSLIASAVNTASLETGSALYNIASSMYCSEVQRFLDQVHGETVALSGFRFFYVTRDIILSVAGTIVTYELVMLQFTNE